jgi:hypothetical protein
VPSPVGRAKLTIICETFAAAAAACGSRQPINPSLADDVPNL